jgi:hypothetical protein
VSFAQLSPGLSPWDLPTARRPILADFNNCPVQNDALNPPIPGAMMTAPQWQMTDALMVALARVTPSARISVAAGTTPKIVGCQTAGNTLSSANFVVTRNAAGDYSITWAQPSSATTWSPASTYATGAFVLPPQATGFYYKATTGGTSAITQPIWPMAVGATVTDGTTTWTCWGIVSSLPTPASQPSARLNAPAGLTNLNTAASVSAINIPNGVRVTTALQTLLADVNFTVDLW